MSPPVSDKCTLQVPVKKHCQPFKEGRKKEERRAGRGEEENRDTGQEGKEDAESERVRDMCYLFPSCKHREKADIINRKPQIVNRRL